MKKFLLTLALAASFGFANAAEVTFDFTTNKYGLTAVDSNTKDDKNTTDVNEEYPNVGTTITNDGVSITLDKLDGSGCRLWVARGNYTFRVNNKSAITIASASGNITKIAIDGGSNLTYLSTTVGTLGTNTSTAFSWTGSETSVQLKNTGASGKTGTVQIKKLIVTIDDGGAPDTRKEPGLSFPQAKYTATLGEAFENPVLTKTTTADVEYSSDAEAVATVDENTGAITLVGEGTARITATAAANDEYKAGSASYLLTVSKAAPSAALFYSALGEEFEFENPEGIAVWKHDSQYGLKGSAFINKKVNAAVAVAASPVIDLTNCVDATLAFEAAYNQYMLNNVLIDMANFDPEYATVVVREEGATEWTKLADVTLPESFSWTFIENAPVSLKAYAGKKIQFGFRYMSTAEVAGTWEVKEFTVTGITSGIDAIEADTNAPVEYYNLQGVRVANPESGLYIRRQGNKVAKILVK